MTNRNKIICKTVLIWALVTIAYAYLYVKNVLSLTGLQGYEAEWDWQLLFFAIVRLPWLVLVLAVILGLEITFIKNKPNPSIKRDALKRAPCILSPTQK